MFYVAPLRVHSAIPLRVLEGAGRGGPEAPSLKSGSNNHAWRGCGKRSEEGTIYLYIYTHTDIHTYVHTDKYPFIYLSLAGPSIFGIWGVTRGASYPSLGRKDQTTLEGCMFQNMVYDPSFMDYLVLQVYVSGLTGHCGRLSGCFCLFCAPPYRTAKPSQRVQLANIWAL